MKSTFTQASCIEDTSAWNTMKQRTIDMINLIYDNLETRSGLPYAGGEEREANFLQSFEETIAVFRQRYACIEDFLREEMQETILMAQRKGLTLQQDDIPFNDENIKSYIKAMNAWVYKGLPIGPVVECADGQKRCRTLCTIQLCEHFTGDFFVSLPLKIAAIQKNLQDKPDIEPSVTVQAPASLRISQPF